MNSLFNKERKRWSISSSFILSSLVFLSVIETRADRSSPEVLNPVNPTSSNEVAPGSVDWTQFQLVEGNRKKKMRLFDKANNAKSSVLEALAYTGKVIDIGLFTPAAPLAVGAGKVMMAATTAVAGGVIAAHEHIRNQDFVTLVGDDELEAKVKTEFGFEPNEMERYNKLMKEDRTRVEAEQIKEVHEAISSEKTIGGKAKVAVQQGTSSLANQVVPVMKRSGRNAFRPVSQLLKLDGDRISREMFRVRRGTFKYNNLEEYLKDYPEFRSQPKKTVVGQVGKLIKENTGSSDENDEPTYCKRLKNMGEEFFKSKAQLDMRLSFNEHKTLCERVTAYEEILQKNPKKYAGSADSSDLRQAKESVLGLINKKRKNPVPEDWTERSRDPHYVHRLLQAELEQKKIDDGCRNLFNKDGIKERLISQCEQEQNEQRIKYQLKWNRYKPELEIPNCRKAIEEAIQDPSKVTGSKDVAMVRTTTKGKSPAFVAGLVKDALWGKSPDQIKDEKDFEETRIYKMRCDIEGMEKMWPIYFEVPQPPKPSGFGSALCPLFRGPQIFGNNVRNIFSVLRFAPSPSNTPPGDNGGSHNVGNESSVLDDRSALRTTTKPRATVVKNTAKPKAQGKKATNAVVPVNKPIGNDIELGIIGSGAGSIDWFSFFD